jgi:putative membrane protein insertion efficiency factor
MERSKVRRTILTAAVVAIFAGVVVHDFAVPPSKAYGTRSALAAIASYRAHISPHLRGVVRCRFTPSCSAYGYESVRKYGLLRGGARAAWRILRCGPWTKLGTVDPP